VNKIKEAYIMDIKDIRDLIITIDKTSIEKVEIENKDFIIPFSASKKLNIERIL